MSDDHGQIDKTRRLLISALVTVPTALLPGFAWGRDSIVARTLSNRSPYGELQAADSNGVCLPRGFRARLLATAGSPVATTGYTWPYAADRAGTFASAGGWIVVVNAELDDNGGASAIRFAADGSVIDAYPVLQGTRRNCAGGITPWGTWLSCEEYAEGHVWECDPAGQRPAARRPALGRFKHEAAAVDPQTSRVYLTEDHRQGRLYRFTPAQWGDLSAGHLQVARVEHGQVQWLPAPADRPYRGPDATVFRRGEGAWLADRLLYFSTTADHRVWVLDIDRDRLDIHYDGEAAGEAGILREPDNITAHRGSGHVYVAEDGDDLQLVLLGTRQGIPFAAPFLQLSGHDGSEVTGPVFNPDGDRLYVSSQRGRDGRGMTFEISGPFSTP